MVASVAVLSDVHGALPALEAVLAEPDVRAAERIVLTGDIAAGPLPVETLDLLVSLGDRVTWVRGNADRELVAVARGGTSGIDVSDWAGRQLRPDQVDLLAALPHPVTLDVDGFGPVSFCHGTPRDDDEVVLVDSSLERWAEVLSTVPGDVRTVVCGHTHMPFQRLVDRRLVVNPGSVGMPYGRPGPHWALLRDGVVTLRRTAVDPDALADAVVAASAYPGARAWADAYARTVHSDAEALTVFAPRDGRTVTRR
ncbi:metallophosphoesterase family protein [Jiangella alkaliphila]|uniref:Phosphoesterase, MJ0936 family n=1 Tax=Jiangella alkaliphila TaxID=419479 RepID=A0A1H2K9Y6_9ACTN|nr:metallophosphoesterase family protein [Jiangella alkaliphila]SDU65281.1 phosphoesterase, MJ0936 family [Jiangella alkaliphila]